MFVSCLTSLFNTKLNYTVVLLKSPNVCGDKNKTNLIKGNIQFLKVCLNNYQVFIGRLTVFCCDDSCCSYRPLRDLLLTHLQWKGDKIHSPVLCKKAFKSLTAAIMRLQQPESDKSSGQEDKIPSFCLYCFTAAQEWNTQREFCTLETATLEDTYLFCQDLRVF